MDSAQKANTQARLVERNLCFISGTGNCGVGGYLSKGQPPLPTPNKQGTKSFYRQKWGQLPAGTAHLLTSLTLIFRLVLTSIILGVLGTVTLQFQGPFVPISLQPNLGTAAAHVLGIVGCQVVNFSTWCFSIYKRVHRIWLRILYIALEKELKVLDYAS